MRIDETQGLANTLLSKKGTWLAHPEYPNIVLVAGRLSQIHAVFAGQLEQAGIAGRVGLGGQLVKHLGQPNALYLSLSPYLDDLRELVLSGYRKE